VRNLVIAAFVMCVVSPARAQTTLRIATLAPEGTMWARVMHDWERNVQEASATVRLKVILGGIAGDEVAVGERIRRGQLDGAISAGTLCQQVAPSIRVLKVVGLFQDRDEATYVLNRLKPLFDKEAAANGFVNLGEGSIGSIIVFSRKPITSMAELRQTPLWTGRQDDFTLAQLNALGLHALPQPLAEAAGEYRSGSIDGFLTVPSVALSWQWSTQVGYFTDLRMSFLFSCLLVSNASFDGLPLEAQNGFRNATARMMVRMEALARQQDDALVSEIFVKQGLKQIRVDERFRTEFFEAAQQSRERVSEKLLPGELMRTVLSMLADHRAQHREHERDR
jgi:TRAP-type C4-dicarboxylate transport system substrate-binding protein